MKPQAAGKTSPAIYRCVTTSVHGRGRSPATISKTRIEDCVLREFVDRADTYLVGESTEADTTMRRRSFAEAQAAEQRYRAALTNVALRAKIGGVDHDALVTSLSDDWQAKRRAIEVETRQPLAVAPPPGVTIAELVERLRDEDKNEQLRNGRPGRKRTQTARWLTERASPSGIARSDDGL